MIASLNVWSLLLHYTQTHMAKEDQVEDFLFINFIVEYN